MTDNPQETVRELRELVVAYAKQETVDPLKGLAKYAGFGIGGAILMGSGFVFIAIGALRLLQGWGPGEQGHHFTGNWSFVPYAIVIVGSAIVALIAWSMRGKRKARTSERRAK